MWISIIICAVQCCFFTMPCVLSNVINVCVFVCLSHAVRTTCRRICLTRSFWGDWSSPALTGTTSLTQPRLALHTQTHIYCTQNHTHSVKKWLWYMLMPNQNTMNYDTSLWNILLCWLGRGYWLMAAVCRRTQKPSKWMSCIKVAALSAGKR